MQRETLQTRKDPKGFEVRTEKVTRDKNDSVVLDSCYNEQSEYVGDFETAAFLYNLGIRPECIPGNKVCSIGFQEEEGKWYGWSHRAICGFGVGDIVKEGDCTANSGWTPEYLPKLLGLKPPPSRGTL